MDINMKDLSFSIKPYKFHLVGIFNDDPLGKKHSTLFILKNLELRFETCVLNLIWK
jgi:hypothetical protein